MSSSVVVLVGPARSGKTHELVGAYRSAVESKPGEPGRTIWLAPTGRTAAKVRSMLVGRGLRACLRPGVVTFRDLASQVLNATGARARRLTIATKREMLRRVVARAIENGTLSYFADAARRPGFIQLLAQHIAELKLRDISPNARAPKSGTRATQWAELQQLYLDYESQLLRHELLDDEGMLQAARDALAKKKCPGFQSLDLLVADGFTDFTAVEFDILRRLTQGSKQTYFSLPNEQDREDLFAKVAATLNQLRHDFPGVDVRELKARPLSTSIVDFVVENIFRHPTSRRALPDDARESLRQIEIVEAAGAQDEINQVARRIKERLVAGVGGDDIVVVFRSLVEAAPRIREVFSRFGIPYSLDAGQPIVAAPFVKTLISLLRLDQEDWAFRRLVSVITNNMLSSLDGSSRLAADWLVRDLQIAAGRKGLVSRVESLAADATSPRDRSDHLQRRVETAAAALPLLQQLGAALDELPKSATMSEWLKALAGLATKLGIAPFERSNAGQAAADAKGQLPEGEAETFPALDIDGWNSIVEHFKALERLDTWLQHPPRKRSRAEMLSLLVDIATNERLPRAGNETGCVRVLGAQAARNITARHLFLAGMSEQAFPSPERAGDLASDADYRLIQAAARGSSADGSATSPTRSQDEMLLFYEVISRAEESLTISYPALDDKAQILPPSPYVVEIERVLGEENFDCIRRTPHLSPIAKDDAEPYSVNDWRIAAIARATKPEGERRLLAGLLASDELHPLAGAIDAGLRIVHARSRGESFGPAEGLLTSPAIAARLAERFGRKHAWSASQWETYAACPFRFFMQEVLGLEPLGDLVLETDFARRGSRLHDILAAFHRDWTDKRAKESIPAGDEAPAFLAHLQEVINDRTSTANRVGIDAALLELDRRQIVKWAKAHYDHQAAYHSGCAKQGAAMTPTHFEFRFGSAARGDAYADPKSTKDAFVIELDGESIQVTGQIDRIDVGKVGGTDVFNVIDYKSGRRASLKREHLEAGLQLQLPIYVEAAQVLLFDNKAVPMQAGYWAMGSGFDSRGALAAKQDEKTDRWTEAQSIVRRLIGQFISGIRHGDFPVASRDDKCTSTCDYHMACRVSQVRSIGKIWWTDDPQIK